LGMTPRDYIDAHRFRRLKKSLRSGVTVSAAQFDAGFGSSRALYERASDHLGMTPASYRRGGRGARIRFGVTQCALGRVIVATTDRGICAVRLGDTAAELTHELESEFPEAEIYRDDTSLEPLIRRVVSACDGSAETGAGDDLPFDIVATAFQWAVWRELRAIPVGETRTYSQIARAVGSPKAVRAVGNACAANPLAVVIPCHRVTRGDGADGGYRWGPERKRRLLASEQKEARRSTRP
jgi:AraC family transcriptional regulator, regulatory protein of adaptative response / methylated-DNA-[protein]-cysteine methyltransferase